MYKAVDVDSDGDWDLMVGTLLLQQLADGTLKYVADADDPVPRRWSSLHGLAPPCLVYGDVDRDGVKDLAVGFKDGRLDLGFRRAIAGGLGTPRPSSESPLQGLGLQKGPKTPGAVDWNLDGKLDLVVSMPGKLQLFLREADGSLNEEAANALSGSAPCLSITAADWTMDGHDDLLLVQERGLVLLEWKGSNFLPPAQVFSWPDGVGPVVGGAVADWDSDGLLDVIAGLASGRLLYWRQDAVGKLELVPEAWAC